jgi:hypothetical protein
MTSCRRPISGAVENFLKSWGASIKPQATSVKRSHCGSLESGLKIDLTERYNMNTIEALKIVGGLSKPSKMPGWAYGIPAAECKTGKKLQDVVGSTCEGCYATKGCYVFRLYKQLNTDALRQSSHRYGLALWLF